MALSKKNLLILSLLGLIAFSPVSLAQKRYEEEEEETSDPTLAMNRAIKSGVSDDNDIIEDNKPRAVRSKAAPLLDTFRGTTKAVADDGIWKERGSALLWYDANDSLISIEVTNNQADNLEEMFTKMCDEQALYSLKLPDFELITTQSACLYKNRGLNETLTFFTDVKGKNLISFTYNVSQ